MNDEPSITPLGDLVRFPCSASETDSVSVGACVSANSTPDDRRVVLVIDQTYQDLALLVYNAVAYDGWVDNKVVLMPAAARSLAAALLDAADLADGTSPALWIEGAE